MSPAIEGALAPAVRMTFAGEILFMGFGMGGFPMRRPLLDGDAKGNKGPTQVEENEDRGTREPQQPCRFPGHALESTFGGIGRAQDFGNGFDAAYRHLYLPLDLEAWNQGGT
jgi:hypothetical protein